MIYIYIYIDFYTNKNSSSSSSGGGAVGNIDGTYDPLSMNPIKKIEFPCPHEKVGVVIGANGATIKEIMKRSNSRYIYSIIDYYILKYYM